MLIIVVLGCFAIWIFLCVIFTECKGVVVTGTRVSRGNLQLKLDAIGSIGVEAKKFDPLPREIKIIGKGCIDCSNLLSA